MEQNFYEINKTTYALLSKNNQTEIIDESGKKVINKQKNVILNYSCAYYGSSLKGRLEGSKAALGSKYKLPIIVEETQEIIFFPTSSPDNEDCCWISLNNIVNYEQNFKNVTVIFKNNTKINLNISYESFENQYLRASKLLLILKNRKNKLQTN